MTAARNRNINTRAQHAKGAIFIDTPRGSSPSVKAHLAMHATAAAKQSNSAEAKASSEGVRPTRLGPHHVEPTGQRKATTSRWQRAMVLRHVGSHTQNTINLSNSMLPTEVRWLRPPARSKGLLKRLRRCVQLLLQQISLSLTLVI